MNPIAVYQSLNVISLHYLEFPKFINHNRSNYASLENNNISVVCLLGWLVRTSFLYACRQKKKAILLYAFYFLLLFTY